MNWKLKAKIQKAVSILPASASYATYYWIQRHFGGLKKINPINRLTAGIEIWKRIKRLGYDPVDKVFFEVGTGRAPIVPLAYWLMGAKKIITIDLNPYLKEELIKESIQYISDNKNEIVNIFGLLLDKERLNNINILYNKFSLSDFFCLCGIEYIAPGDATNTQLSSSSIDFHTSYTVFEHIPP